jgi:hypothetical protein
MRITQWKYEAFAMAIAVAGIVGGCSDRGTSTTSPSALPSAGALPQSEAHEGGAHGSKW